MDSYFEIKALPNPEILQSEVVSYLMQHLHTVLPQFEGRIGLGFPAYGQLRTVGGIIRVIGSEEDITRLKESLVELAEVRDYGLLTDISYVPERITKFASYHRVHTKGNSHLKRLKKRQLARGTWSDEHERKVQERYQEALKLPHLKLKSGSTGQRFLLFVKQRISVSETKGLFNGYGLGKENATVPWF
jgi:CRISPR-associated endonuclease Csy4